MRQFKFGLAMLVTLILVGCSGGNSDVPAKPKFTAQVSFGDSLSDVGTYKVGVVAAYGGGEFTINPVSAVPAIPTNWTELAAVKLGVPAPCAAETGLADGSGTTPSATNVPVVTHAGCTGYAQGGARVTDPSGIGNATNPVQPGIFLTVPVVTQIQNFLNAHGGSFSGDEVVTVMAGANDVFYHAGIASANPSYAASAVQAVQTAATDLANDVNIQIIGKGAKYVVVANIPDIASTPYGNSINNHNANPALNPVNFLNTLVTTFNNQLKASLPDSAIVLNVDAYTASQDEVANKDKYNLTNVTGTACNLSYGVNALATPTALGSSLVCNATNLNPGVLSTDHYMFADTVHPTPYGHSLFALYVLQAMTNKGWY